MNKQSPSSFPADHDGNNGILMQIQSARPIIRLWYWQRATLALLSAELLPRVAGGAATRARIFRTAHVRALDQKGEKNRRMKIRLFVTSARFAWLVNLTTVCRASMRVRVLACVSKLFAISIRMWEVNEKKREKKIEGKGGRERERKNSLVTLLVICDIGLNVGGELKNAEISDTREDYETRLYYTSSPTFMKQQIENSARCLLFDSISRWTRIFRNFRNIERAIKISCRSDKVLLAIFW